VAQLVRMTLAIEDAAKGGLAAQVSAVQTRNKNGDTSQDSAT